MPRKKETRLQLRIHDALRREFPELWGFKVHGNEFQREGLPDRIYCICGLFFAFEVKRPGEKPTRLQEYEIEKIKAAGGVASIVEDAATAIELVRAALARAKKRR
jgi:hypothetical protein